jgi:hypothetical protein
MSLPNYLTRIVQNQKRAEQDEILGSNRKITRENG